MDSLEQQTLSQSVLKEVTILKSCQISGNYVKVLIIKENIGNIYVIIIASRGLCITITQVLDYRPKAKAYRFLSYKKPELLRCPKMAHSLEITFNDLKDFNTNLAKLNKKEPYCNNRNDINFIIES